MSTEDAWVARLDRQWLSLRVTEQVLSLLLEDGKDVELTRRNLERHASDYGLSVRHAPAAALLRHASNIRHVSH